MRFMPASGMVSAMACIMAGIDEAGYGPAFGPLVFGLSVFKVPEPEVDLWDALSVAVTRENRDKQGRITINDSKKVHSGAQGFARLERGVHAFGADDRSQAWQQTDLPWYALADETQSVDRGQIHIARAMRLRAEQAAEVQTLALHTQCIYEDRFNAMAAAMRSKAAISLTCIGKLLDQLWRKFSSQGIHVAVDRQSGRQHYRQWLTQIFDGATLTTQREDAKCSSYLLEAGERSMRVSFEVSADDLHFPVALASMAAKYQRQLAMQRFNTFFAQHTPEIKPTQGYGSDAKRFWQEIQPHLPRLRIDAAQFRRLC